MGLRRAACYSSRPCMPYTRKSKVKKKSYIKSVPGTKITKLRMGDLPGYKDGKYKIVLTVFTKQNVQLRDTALEAARMFLNRFLAERIGKEYYFEVRPYPHHILRENKMITGAGADRMQTGMALSFGKSMGRACIMKRGDILFIIGITSPKSEAVARELLGSVRARLPCQIHVETERKK